MNTKELLQNDLKDAMKTGDELRKRTIRMVLAAIRQVEIDKSQALDEAGVQAILQKEIKSRQESIADAQRAQRPDLVEVAQQEIIVLEGYLPRQLTPQELDELARQAIADVGAASPKEMGQVMKVLMPRLQGQATGDQASQAVRRLLSG
jgi:uncharacterized protein YqeY